MGNTVNAIAQSLNTTTATITMKEKQCIFSPTDYYKDNNVMHVVFVVIGWGEYPNRLGYEITLNNDM